MIREPTPYYDKWLVNRKKKKSQALILPLAGALGNQRVAVV